MRFKTMRLMTICNELKRTISTSGIVSELDTGGVPARTLALHPIMNGYISFTCDIIIYNMCVIQCKMTHIIIIIIINI